ncbi:hypothetical protein [Estrella lausannensis]|uniref:Uncharacterized protein n=1 Tax=Estrella lausannensis TaxID=483423 RepID=A0A0H5DN68_9BACT|nr:hypothetical protein [Estrella lausannensis]CRX37547.1 hypothetical protein ELAC_0186 [Estrella lausannensis]
MTPAQGTNNPVRYEDVYYVESLKKDSYINPIAIRPTIVGERIEWADTSRGTYRKFKQIQVMPENQLSPERINILAKDDEEITLTRMTLDVYNRFLKHRVAGQPSFNSDEELKQHYLTTNFDLYPLS